VHPSEAKLVKLLKKRKEETGKPEALASELSPEMGVDKSAVGRIAYSLSKKGAVEVEKLSKSSIVLTEEGEAVARRGVPERVLLKQLPKKLDEVEDRLALNWALKRKWVEIKGKKVVAAVENPPLTEEEIALKKKVLPGSKEAALLKKRKWAREKKEVDYLVRLTEEGEKVEAKGAITQLTPGLLKGGKWRKKEFLPFSPNTPVPPKYAGRYHPLSDIIEKIRRVFLEMGFMEADGPHVESGFWCFDALFVPQDHPAREMQDTFYMEGEAELPEVAAAVSKVHEGLWGGWDPKEATRKLLRTHMTGVSARMLSKLEPPAKVFSIGRAFRNETVDYKHLAEFYQVDGIVFDEGVNFNNLVGYLKSFFRKLGFPKIRVRPGYFPYTEVSAEVDVWFESKKSWIELGGSGIFRPEVVKPLTGKDTHVLAWGLGIERIAMLKYGLRDIRELYRSDLKWLRDREVFL